MQFVLFSDAEREILVGVFSVGGGDLRVILETVVFGDKL